MTPPKIIVVYGPTACGKTALSLKLAKEFDGEVLSADSRQVFRGMDIGTGKIRSEEMEDIPHHCLDLADPSKEFSAIEFRTAARAALEDVHSRGKTLVVCGGTGLYIDVFLFEFNVPEVPPNPVFRQKMENFRLEHGNRALWELLNAKDPEYAAEIHENNHRYVVRALEVADATGKSKKEFASERRLKYPETVFITPYDDHDRAALYAKIDGRVLSMFENGLVEETRALSEKYGADAFGLDTIGYAETLRHLSGELSLSDTIALVQKDSRNYAKRQVTWNARYAELPRLSLS